MLLKLPQFLNALLPIEVTPFSIFKLVNPQQSEKASSPIVFTVFGIVTAMASQSSHIGFALPISQKLILELLDKSKSSLK